jgi:hypothetical protein
MKARFACYSTAAFLAGGVLAASAMAADQSTSTTPKLTPGRFLFNAIELGSTYLTPSCPFQANGTYEFLFVYSSSGNSTMRFAAPYGIGAYYGPPYGSTVVVVTVPKKTGSGPWDVTYSANAYDSTGTKLQNWTGTFVWNGVPADTETIAISLQLTNWPDPVDATTCSPVFNASGWMMSPGS